MKRMRRPFYIIIQYLNFERSFIVSKQMVADATQSGDKRNAFCQSFHESSIKLTEFWNDLPRSELGSNHPGFNMFQHCSIRTSFPSFYPRPKLRGSVEAWTATTTSSRVHAGRGDGPHQNQILHLDSLDSPSIGSVRGMM